MAGWSRCRPWLATFAPAMDASHCTRALHEHSVSRRVLVVDDEEGIRGALGQLLEYEGYEAPAAANAADGLTEFVRWKPHLTFLDVKMGGMDGIEALKQMRQL